MWRKAAAAAHATGLARAKEERGAERTIRFTPLYPSYLPLLGRFFDEFLFHILRNQMRTGASQTSFRVTTPLVALTANEAGRIARSFVMVLMASTTGAAATDELIATYPALRELDREYRWFRPMMDAIAIELMSQVAYGVKVSQRSRGVIIVSSRVKLTFLHARPQFRAGLGASVSFADMLTDAYVIQLYFSTGRAGAAKSLLAMVCANMAYQSLIVFVQTIGLKKDRWRTMLLEFLSVVTFVKPGVDAWRVVSGAERKPGAPLSPLMEMVNTKSGELVFEAVPGLVLQLVAMIKFAGAGETNSTSAFISVLVSTASTALTGTTLFWDGDTDPGIRKRNPDW
jgi:hypothetical protein